MEGIFNYLQNLKPGGSSKIPTSKFEKKYTEDSELDSPDDKKEEKQTTEEKSIDSKKPRKTLVKQQADVHRDSSDIIETPKNRHESTEVKSNSVPRVKKIQKLNDPEEGQVAKLWKDLKIGEDGYLTISELDKVCSHLGIKNLDQNDLKNLFKKIDTNNDGRVSIEEFSTGLKEYSKMRGVGNQILNLSSSSVSGLFTSLDPNKTGTCEVGTIVQFWASGGILNGMEVLEYFDFSRHENVNLILLSTALEDEISVTSLDAITLASIITYQKELYYCRSKLEKLQSESSKHEVYSDQQRNEYKPQENSVPQENSQTSIMKKKIEYEHIIRELTKEKQDLENRLKAFDDMDMENTQMPSRIKELEEINLRQVEELDAVADLHRKMDLELKIYRDNQSSTKGHDKDFEKNLFLAENKIYQLEKELSKKVNQCKDLEDQVNELTEMNRSQNTIIKTFSVTDEKKKDKDRIGGAKLPLESRDLQRNHTFKNVSEEKYIALQKENDTLKKKLMSLSTKIEIAINRENQYQIKLKEKEREFQRLVDMEDQLTELDNQITKQKYEYEKKLNKSSEEILKLEKEKQYLTTSLNHLEEQLLDSKQNYLNNQENIKRKYETLENQMIQYSNIKSEIDSRRDENKSKDIIIKKLEEANDRLSISLRNASAKLELLTKKNLEINSNQLLNENIEIQKENILLEEEINKLKINRERRDSSQSRTSTNDIRNLEAEIAKKNFRINELEERMKRSHRGESPNLNSAEKKSFKKYDFLQFQFDELNKKYHIQLEQVEKSDALLKELYEGNTKLLKSLNKMEELKESSEMRVAFLEEKVKTLQNLLNRE